MVLPAPRGTEEVDPAAPGEPGPVAEPIMGSDPEAADP